MNLPATRETWVRSLGRKDPLKEGMATGSSVRLENPMDRGAAGLWSMGLKGSDTTERLSPAQCSPPADGGPVQGQVRGDTPGGRVSGVQQQRGAWCPGGLPGSGSWGWCWWVQTREALECGVEAAGHAGTGVPSPSRRGSARRALQAPDPLPKPF